MTNGAENSKAVRLKRNYEERNYLPARMIQYLDMRGRAIRLQRQLLTIVDRADQSRRDKRTDGSRVIVRVTTVELV